ncbi:Oidioi.mRNA.OKI2018_I69.XSR.g13374.t1.cds [Oikopleura dioica]|uniref:Oidioi.mRNA.OKI2018_I69.XSR.g13374.t1.cds n=1 Tax=Oikopleura dioica TaxID=34765 RepID=A0ABN7SAE5_OIKDI|nr:Oidioi.mRNA.OKI2018_I69.XSR.g13374.t1.cds [Oikopleura dioica]
MLRDEMKESLIARESVSSKEFIFNGLKLAFFCILTALFLANLYVTMDLCRLQNQQLELNRVFADSIFELTGNQQDQSKILAKLEEIVGNPEVNALERR